MTKHEPIRRTVKRGDTVFIGPDMAAYQNIAHNAGLQVEPHGQHKELDRIMHLVEMLDPCVFALEAVADRALGQCVADDSHTLANDGAGATADIRGAIVRLHHRLEAVTKRLEQLA